VLWRRNMESGPISGTYGGHVSGRSRNRKLSDFHLLLDVEFQARNYEHRRAADDLGTCSVAEAKGSFQVSPRVRSPRTPMEGEALQHSADESSGSAGFTLSAPL
jgi:hypothetical protein